MTTVAITDDALAEARKMNELMAMVTAALPSMRDPDALERLRANGELMGGPPVDAIEERTIPGPAGPLPARVYRPDTVDAVYLDFHGGAWCIGSARQQDGLLSELAEAAHVATISVDYRLAPEHPFPAAVDDCEAATRWVLDHAADEFGTSTVVIGGSSAGAHLAVLAVLRLRASDPSLMARITGLNLLFGPYDLGMTPSMRQGADAILINRPVVEASIEHFLPGLDAEARRDPMYSPLYADLRDLPPARFTVGSLDPLLDDSLFMAARWEAAGNHAELDVTPESPHGFSAMPTELGRAARARYTDFVRRIIAP